MDQLQETPGYSLLWASGIVSEFSEKYARATEAVKKFYQITDENVIWWVANRQVRWQNYKKIVKQLHRWSIRQTFLGQAELNYYTSVKDAAHRVLRRQEFTKR